MQRRKLIGSSQCFASCVYVIYNSSENTVLIQVSQNTGRRTPPKRIVLFQTPAPGVKRHSKPRHKRQYTQPLHIIQSIPYTPAGVSGTSEANATPDPLSNIPDSFCPLAQSDCYNAARIQLQSPPNRFLQLGPAH